MPAMTRIWLLVFFCCINQNHTDNEIIIWVAIERFVPRTAAHRRRAAGSALHGNTAHTTNTIPTANTTSSSNDTDSRKHYGLSFDGPCKRYNRVFKCMNQCKSIGYQLYRLDRNCNCSCYQMKTSTILPFFRWKTNGTTKKVPKTHSPRLYDIVGTLSPFPTKTEIPTTVFTCPTLPTAQSADVTPNSTSDSNSTSISTGNGTDVSSDSSGGSEAAPTGNSGATGATGGAESGATGDTTAATWKSVPQYELAAVIEAQYIVCGKTEPGRADETGETVTGVPMRGETGQANEAAQTGETEAPHEEETHQAEDGGTGTAAEGETGAPSEEHDDEPAGVDLYLSSTSITRFILGFNHSCWLVLRHRPTSDWVSLQHLKSFLDFLKIQLSDPDLYVKNATHVPAKVPTSIHIFPNVYHRDVCALIKLPVMCIISLFKPVASLKVGGELGSGVRGCHRGERVLTRRLTLASSRAALCSHLSMEMDIYFTCPPPPSTVAGPCARSARIATTILLANPAVKQQCLHCCVSAWRRRSKQESVMSNVEETSVDKLSAGYTRAIAADPASDATALSPPVRFAYPHTS
ncbi:hypothetical protein MSG28_002255 [Choristoneura fumiferana]|uniref:Uncharacterized protein n=1 Tax=Choristoneura fumiferana TaxID=7141 RepID=A0ACC0JVH7_CHOFU|nr:hypothetical protein MSG28_002255 [Choristoneura fumiferana]